MYLRQEECRTGLTQGQGRCWDSKHPATIFQHDMFNKSAFFFYPVSIVNTRWGDMVDAFATMMRQCCRSSTLRSHRAVSSSLWLCIKVYFKNIPTFVLPTVSKISAYIIQNFVTCECAFQKLVLLLLLYTCPYIGAV